MILDHTTQEKYGKKIEYINHEYMYVTYHAVESIKIYAVENHILRAREIV